MRRLHATLVLVSTFLLSAVFGLLVGFGLDRAELDGRVLRGINVCGENVSGFSALRLGRSLESCEKRWRGRPITLRLRGETLVRTAGQLGLRLSQDEALRDVLRTGRDGSPAAQFIGWIRRWYSPYAVPLEATVRRGELERELLPWVHARVPAPVPPRIVFSLPPQLDSGSVGSSLSFSEVEQQLLRSLHLPGASHDSRSSIELPLREESPMLGPASLEEGLRDATRLLAQPLFLLHPDSDESISLRPEELAKGLSSEVGQGGLAIILSLPRLGEKVERWLSSLESPARDASFSLLPTGKVAIAASERGRAVDRAALTSAILRVREGGARRLQIPFVSVEPALSTAEAEGLGIRGVVASFVTTHKCCQARVENIHLAAQVLDGVVVRPRERFSLNELLGPRVEGRGYRRAPTIVRGEMEETWGGGISQLATTLFNAVLDGGYQIIQRQPHSFYFPRYPEGHEATVSFPEPDLIFRVDTAAGLVIKTQYSGSYIKVILLGDNEGRRVRRKKSQRYDLKAPPIEYEPDENADPEKPRRLRAGQQGWSLVVSRFITFRDGHETEQKREVVYQPRPELLRVHPCMIPEGATGYTGLDCPSPEEESSSEFKEEEREFVDEGYWADPAGADAPVLMNGR